MTRDRPAAGGGDSTLEGEFPSDLGGGGEGSSTSLRANPKVIESLGGGTTRYAAGRILEEFGATVSPADPTPGGYLRPGIFEAVAVGWETRTPLNFAGYSTFSTMNASFTPSEGTLLGGKWQLNLTVSGATTADNVGVTVYANVSEQGYFSSYAASGTAIGYDHVFSTNMSVSSGTPYSLTTTFTMGNFKMLYGETSLSTYNIIGMMNKQITASVNFGTPAASITSLNGSIWPYFFIQDFASTIAEY